MHDLIPIKGDALHLLLSLIVSWIDYRIIYKVGTTTIFKNPFLMMDKINIFIFLS